MASEPPAYGYQPPVPYYKRTLETEKGVKHIHWGIIIYVLAMILSLVSIILTYMFIEEILVETTPGEIPENMGLILGIASVACGFLLLLLIAVVLWLLGLYEMHKGKNEFGPEHSTKVTRGVILVTIYIILFVSSMILSFVLALDISANMDFDVYLERLRILALISAPMNVIMSIVLGLAVVNLVYELCDEKFRRILWFAFFFLVALALVGAIITLTTFYGEFPSEDIYELGRLDALTGVAMGLEVIPFVLFLLCYRHAHIRVKDGGIQPVPGTYAAGYPTTQVQQPYYRQSKGVCPVCGTPAYAGEVFCANCGAKLQ